MSKKLKTYFVTYHLVGEQSALVEATSKKEATRLALETNYGPVDPVDFTIIKVLRSTVRAELNIDLGRADIGE